MTRAPEDTATATAEAAPAAAMSARIIMQINLNRLFLLPEDSFDILSCQSYAKDVDP